MSRPPRTSRRLALWIGFAACAALGSWSGRVATADETPPAATSPAGPNVLAPLVDGPLHEAFLSPRRDLEPAVVPKSPPAPVAESPAVEPPNGEARWIGGYWEWSAARDEFVWVTGTWRVPPPGRFWVNGFWKRDADGWRRVRGFWSDRSTDRIAYRKEGPPKERPVDDPGDPPRPNCFYIPGQHVPDGDGLAWRKGFWTEARAGWAWVPASWTRQPEGWVFQEGYWDRPLEDRGVLFAPATAAGEPRDGDGLSYRPVTVVSQPLYGQLYGAFGRATPFYDGYPGVCYDARGRFFAYADYGNLAPYYGYLDYPYYGGYGYPYFASPIRYSYASIYPGAGYGSLVYGLGLPYYGFGNALLPITIGYPLFGNMGLVGPGWGWGYPGWNSGYALGWGSAGPNWSGLMLGLWPGFNYGSWMWSGPAIGTLPGFGSTLGFPNWTSGWGGFGWSWGGFGPAFAGMGPLGGIWGVNSPPWTNCYPFQNSGRRDAIDLAPPRHRPDQVTNRPGLGDVDRPVFRGPAAHRGLVAADDRGFHGMREEGLRPPPASRPFASLVDRPMRALEPRIAEARDARFAGSMRRGAGDLERPATWNHAFNGIAPAPRIQHEAARPAMLDRGPAGAGAPPLGRMRGGAGEDLVGRRPGGPGGDAAGGFGPRTRDEGAATARVLGLDRLAPQRNPDGGAWQGGMRGRPGGGPEGRADDAMTPEAGARGRFSRASRRSSTANPRP